jgi:hypothetical protein
MEFLEFFNFSLKFLQTLKHTFTGVFSARIFDVHQATATVDWNFAAPYLQPLTGLRHRTNLAYPECFEHTALTG